MCHFLGFIWRNIFPIYNPIGMSIFKKQSEIILIPHHRWCRGDLYEINEVFAVVSLLAIQKLGLDENRVNVNGGACALGHPIGFSGSRIVVTLINALKQRGLTKGVASLCIVGGYRSPVSRNTLYLCISLSICGLYFNLRAGG